MGFPVYDLGLWFETQCRLPWLIGSKALDFGIVSLGLSEVLVDGGLVLADRVAVMASETSNLE